MHGTVGWSFKIWNYTNHCRPDDTVVLRESCYVVQVNVSLWHWHAGLSYDWVWTRSFSLDDPAWQSARLWVKRAPTPSRGLTWSWNRS